MFYAQQLSTNVIVVLQIIIIVVTIWDSLPACLSGAVSLSDVEAKEFTTNEIADARVNAKI